MKLFKKIYISSNGSLYFYNKTEIYKTKTIFFKTNDDKNFLYYQKKSTKLNSDSKISDFYKKKYF